ncbi:type VI secretion system ATPase TssH [Robbsia andropogonis]|uniref:type VI secretion system ATPase TssH n=1 Tax=Robbsia andropogonis TaxID=28092 RepID=UPI0004647AB4|nr:type VI secretion system ATPase TssH [Robbsia andropogonis]
MDTNIRTWLSRLDPRCLSAMEQAAALCVQQTHYSVEPEHLLMQFAQAPDAAWRGVLQECGVDADLVARQLQKAIDGFTRGNARTPALAPDFADWFREGWVLATVTCGLQKIDAGALLLALLALNSLRGRLIDAAPALLNISRDAASQAVMVAQGADKSVGARDLPLLQTDHSDNGLSSGGGMPAGFWPTSDRSTDGLARFTIDITRQAREGRLDPVTGRDPEIRQLIDVLMRRRQNNPILTGEAGVGKTAVVEGFAQRIARGQVPAALRQVRLLSLDLALLQAGAGVKGEFENRLKGVIAQVHASPQPIVLFIDEAHQIIGAGGAEGQGDAANLLKPALARGELRTIAATTWAEYKRYVERDPALARRFQVVKVDEPTEEAAIQMLRGVVRKLAAHHGVEIGDDAVRDAVRLSHRYITGRQLPDKAVSVLDTACARVAVVLAGVSPRIESLDREIAQDEHALGLHRYEAACASASDALAHTALAEKMAALEAQLIEQRGARRKLQEKLETERDVAARINACRARIAAELQKGKDGSDGQDASSCGKRSAQRDASPVASAYPPAEWADDQFCSDRALLQRLEKGLEAIQQDDPLVSVRVNAAAVAEVVSGWTGIPVGRMMADEIHSVLDLKARMGQYIVGQDAALDALARRIRTSRAGLEDPSKPIGVFLLVGPSGVGKTGTALALAELLYGGERNVITVNMSEFQEAHTVSSLKGAPPGYVGYGRGGVLTEAVRRKPYSVVLLDEMEKAHPDVLEVFFQVFDKGTLEDGEGVPIDFRNTIILMTSNAAQSVITDHEEVMRKTVRVAPEEDGHIQGRPEALQDAASLMPVLRDALLHRFSAAFIGRTVIVPYFSLTDKQVRQIVTMKLSTLADRIKLQHRARFQWSDSAAQTIAARCVEVESGARNIDHLLTQTVLPDLSQCILERVATGIALASIWMDVDQDGNFRFHFSDTTENVGVEICNV